MNRFSRGRCVALGLGRRPSERRVRCRGCRIADARRVPRRRVRAVGQDRRPGRRRRRAGAGARRAGRRRASRRRSTSSCRATAACPSRPASSGHSSSASRIRARRRASARSPSSTCRPNGYRLRLVDHPAGLRSRRLLRRRAGDYPDNAWRFGLFCRAALEALRADGRPLDVLHLHDWHTGPAAHPARRPVRVRSGHRRRGDPDDAPQPRLPRLDAEGGTAPARAGAGDGVVPAERRRDRPARERDRARGAGQHGLAGLRGRGADARFGMGLDGALRAKGDRFLGILNGLDTTVWDPATDADLAAPYSREDRAGKAACRADLLTALGFDPADDGPVLGMIGRLDPQKGFDLLADAAPALLERGARLVVQGSGHPELADPFRGARRGQPGRGRAHRAVRPGDGPPDLRRRRLLPDAVAVRAVRPGPDDRAALRHAADRPSDRRPGRHGHRRDDAPGRGDGLRLRRARRPRGCSRRATRRSRMRARGGPAWEGLLDRGMAVDFDWVDGLGAALCRRLPAGGRDPAAEAVAAA